MKRRDDSAEDALLDYIDPAHIEKAPEGFTSRVMENIRLQPAIRQTTVRNRRMRLVPVVSAMIIITLVLIAAFVPESSTNTLPFADALKDIQLPAVNINFDIISLLSIPAWIPYLFLSIFFLMLLDKVLWGLFHRQK